MNELLNLTSKFDRQKMLQIGSWDEFVFSIEFFVVVIFDQLEKVLRMSPAGSTWADLGQTVSYGNTLFWCLLLCMKPEKPKVNIFNQMKVAMK